MKTAGLYLLLHSH